MSDINVGVVTLNNESEEEIFKGTLVSICVVPDGVNPSELDWIPVGKIATKTVTSPYKSTSKKMIINLTSKPWA